MPTTLTIKDVPDELAAKLRLRAEAHERSLQDELMEIILAATTFEATDIAARPKLTLAEMWEASRNMGLHSPDEATQIIRKMRDNRNSG